MKAVATVLSLLAILQCGCSASKSLCTSCPDDHFMCKHSCVCILNSWVCDGRSDCDDKSDEKDCKSSNCPPSNFQCANHYCVQKDWLCDGDNDCGDKSDEVSCPRRKCKDGEMRCANGNCVPTNWKCDGEDDCEDGTDEDCPAKDCKAGQFQCQDGSCIAMMWKCDRESDCHDGSDELNCGTSQIMMCTDGEFQCQRSLKCIRREFLCDNENDCGDWEDELGCGRCQEGEFNCTSGECINAVWHCDGDVDCHDKSDEENCSFRPCTKDQFRCATGFCINQSKRCDGNIDCPDNSDEKSCRPTKCRPDQFRCGNGKCVGLHKVCNDHQECVDGSDETNCDLMISCKKDNGGCQHNCKTTQHGGRCWCKPGYQLASNKKSCHDINECLYDGTCSQSCDNSDGSFQCSCVPGYQLKPDGRGCKALGGEAYLIFANRKDIRRVTPNKSNYTSILQGLQNAIALDFHHKHGLVFWSDVTLDVIKRAHLNGSHVMNIVTDGLDNPGGLAVDWINDKLFWTDAGTSRIEVANLDGSFRKVILWQNMQKPRAIAAHPSRGLIFWTDWGTTPKIERSSMDGSLRMVLFNASLFWPNGLTVDYAAQQLYWADAKHHVIECANLDGTHRRTVISKGLPHPFAVTIFEDELYWTDWHTKSINKANKFTGGLMETVSSRLYFPMDIHTLHPQRQPSAPNLCGLNNGGCSHLCLPNESGFSCFCPTGLKLLNDRKSCADVLDKFVIFSTQSNLRRISLDVGGELTDVVIPLSGVESAVGVEFDSVTDTIFWSDIGADTISRASWNGSHEEVIVSTSLDSPSGLALDWLGRNLYWTDSGNNRIEVGSLDGTLRTVLIWRDLDHPRDIVVHPERGLMFWTVLGKSAKIECAGMDGSNRMVLTSHNTTWPNGLSLDFKDDKLYWVDVGSHTLECSNLEGSDRRTIVSTGVLHPFGINVFESTVYWTDWDTDSIHFADKDTGKSQTVLASGFGNIMDVKVFHRTRQTVPTACGNNNGGCSHLCLLAPSPRNYTCACPTGLLLKSDGKQCHTEMRNFLIFTRRQDIRKISLEVEYYMDVVIPVGEMKNAIAIDVDILEGKMYWTDTMLDHIYRANLDGSHVEKIVQHGIHTADGLAVDSVGRKIYWTDDGHNRIQVANLDGSMMAVLIHQDLDKPRAIALHYDKGYMFWTDWGKHSRIERADMNGNNRRIIISNDLVWPNGLTIDRPTNRIIWADARMEVIECADLLGNFRRKLVTKVRHPYGLTVAGQHIFWTDWNEKSIHRANKNLVANVTMIRDNLPDIMDIHAVQIDGIETHVNRCGQDNGGCSHLCLPHPTGSSCACPTGILMDKDQKTCKDVPSKYLLFAARDSIRRISLDSPDYTDVYLPLSNLYNVIALDYHYKEGMVYFTDVSLDVIRRAFLNGSDWVETVVQKELATTDGLAVDWIAANLYWTDAGRDMIEVSRLDGTSRKTLIHKDLQEPRAIALFPQKGLMFWTDWGKQPRIERSYLDGTHRKVIADKYLGYPNALSIDYGSLRLYWVDALLDKIETSDFEGRNRITLLQQVPHPFGLTVFDSSIYWTDWQTEKVEQANKQTGKDRVTLQSRLEGLMDVHMVAPNRQTGDNKCSVNNGGCSHLCLARPDRKVTCACPNILDDGRPCQNYASYDNENNPDVGNGDIDPIYRCSEEDKALGICEDLISEHQEHGLGEDVQQEVADNTVPIAVVTAILFILLVIIVVAFLLWKRHRRRNYNVEGFSVLTYTNLTYQKTSTETIDSAHSRARRAPPHLRFHASDERLSYGGHSDVDSISTHTETAALMPPQGNHETRSNPPTPLVKHCGLGVAKKEEAGRQTDSHERLAT